MSNQLTSVEQAAIPSAVAVLQAVQAFISNMGTDPAQWALKFPGALVALQGAVGRVSRGTSRC